MFVTIKAPDTSPSDISFKFTFISLSLSIIFLCLGLSNKQAVISLIFLFKDSAIFLIFFSIEKSKSVASLELYYTASLSIYVSGALNRFPFSAIDITDSAPGKFFATKFVPSSGSTAISSLNLHQT